MLEDLCLEAVADDKAMRCVDGFFNCLKDNKLDISKNKSKAKLQVFLASRREADIDLGIAVRKHYIPLDHHLLAPLRKFLHQLTEPPQSQPQARKKPK